MRTVFLDAGGVLVFPNWDRVADTLRRHGIDVSGAALRRVEPRVKFAIDTAVSVSSTTDAQRGGTYVEGVLDAAGVPRAPARAGALEELYAYHAAHNLWEHVPTEVPSALERLRNLGLRLAVVSNANGVVQRAFERAGIAEYFDAICDSCVEGVEKPDPRFFEIALARTASQRETTVHVGDLYHVDVVGARRANLRPVLVDPHGLYGAFDVERIGGVHELAARLATAGNPQAP